MERVITRFISIRKKEKKKKRDKNEQQILKLHSPEADEV